MAIAVRPESDERPIEARFEALVLDFLAYLEFERGLARNTLDAYRTDLLQYGAFLAGRGTGPSRPTAETSPTSWPTSRPDDRRPTTSPRGRRAHRRP